MKYSKIEFGIATIFFITVTIATIQNITHHYLYINSLSLNSYLGELFPYLLSYVATYSAFLALNYVVWPRYWLKKKYFEAVGLTIVLLIIVGLADMVLYSHLREWEFNRGSVSHAYKVFFSYGFVMASSFLLIYVLYVVVREGIIYQYKLSSGTQSLPAKITREIILISSLWLIILFPLLILKSASAFRDFGPFYCFVLPYCFALYFLNLYWLIPGYKKEHPASLLIYFSRLMGTAILLGIIEMAFLLQFHYFTFFGHLVIHWFAPTLVTIAISWWVYLANKEKYKQLTSLKAALGTSNANLQYLRSQINPHFLFNALNTLYGAALMEKAEKTGEGIQKLGDMMRFMLHENNQDKIALSRELDYIHNYIDLQNMRLALSPDMIIDIQIEEMVGYNEIAPMLLIPFIENAYKHGISLQEKSWINVNLYKNENILHLDVHNSVHPVNINDPERYHSGTGLENVKQRLQLLYPNRHELVVRQNTKEFFVHLSLTLDQQKPI
ncbi:sensor histidine kinase [Mucilaginibacter boryungensis]|nr:histidine kinase [Mucilaginibacter boryungensis]